MRIVCLVLEGATAATITEQLDHPSTDSRATTPHNHRHLNNISATTSRHRVIFPLYDSDCKTNGCNEIASKTVLLNVSVGYVNVNLLYKNVSTKSKKKWIKEM